MDLPDEKESGMSNFIQPVDEEVVESMALDDKPTPVKPLGPAKMTNKILGPNMMRQKIQQNLEERKADPTKRPPSQMKK